MFCTNCGSRLQDGDVFCTECGARQDEEAMPEAGQNDTDTGNIIGIGQTENDAPVPAMPQEEAVPPSAVPDAVPGTEGFGAPGYIPVPPTENGFGMPPMMPGDMNGGAPVPPFAANPMMPPPPAGFQPGYMNAPMPPMAPPAPPAPPAPKAKRPKKSHAAPPAEPYVVPPMPYGVPPVQPEQPYPGFEKEVKPEKEKNGKMIVLAIIAGCVAIAAIAALIIVLCLKSDRNDNDSSEGNTSSYNSSSYDDEDSYYERSDDMESHNSDYYLNPYWLVSPEISAKDITPVYCPNPSTAGYNGYSLDYLATAGRHHDDRVSLMKNGGVYRLILTNGGKVTGYDLDKVEVTDEGDTMLLRLSGKGGKYYEFTPQYEMKKVKTDDKLSELTPSADGTKLVYWEGYGLAVDSGGSVDLLENVDYIFNTSMAVPYYNAEANPAGGYVLVLNGRVKDTTVYEDAGAFCSGVIPLKKNGKWGYVNYNGELVLDFRYDDCWNIYSDNGVDPNAKKAFNASYGYIVVCLNGDYAMYDIEGNRLIDYGEYSELRPVYDSTCWAKQDGKWGVLNVDGSGKVDYVEKPDHFDYPSGKAAKIDCSSGVRIRETPDSESCVITIASNRAKVSVYATRDEWSYVCYKETYGWVASKYVKYT